MTPFLSIIIPCWNEPQNLVGTIRSIEDTAATCPIDILVIDDGGTVPFDWESLGQISKRVRVFHGARRNGCSVCRQWGSTLTSSEWLLFTDAHMEFEPCWFEAFRTQTQFHDSKTLFCGPFISCRVPDEPPDIFWGARLYYWDQEGDGIDVLSYKPIGRPPEGLDKAWSFEVPCVIGANYFIRRDWFHAIDGLKCFHGWATQEEFMLSLKTWLFGGRVNLIPDVRLRHLFFQSAHGQGINSMARGELLFNKLSCAYQIFPEHVYQPFVKALPADEAFEVAYRMIEEKREELDAARAYFARNIRRGHDWLCSKFNLLHPLDIGAAQYTTAVPAFPA